MITEINSIYNDVQKKILLTPCEPIFNGQVTSEIQDLITNLIDTAHYHEHCIGLTANQIWANPINPAPAVFVIRTGTEYQAILNPQVDKMFNKLIPDKEGCMSLPKSTIVIKKRPKHIVVSYYDTDGHFSQNVHLYDIMARIFLHEMDHINGTLITPGV